MQARGCRAKPADLRVKCRADASPAATEAVALQFRRVQTIIDLLQEALDFVGVF
jgi:hypothetical protein